MHLRRKKSSSLISFGSLAQHFDIICWKKKKKYSHCNLFGVGIPPCVLLSHFGYTIYHKLLYFSKNDLPPFLEVMTYYMHKPSSRFMNSNSHPPVREYFANVCLILPHSETRKDPTKFLQKHLIICCLNWEVDEAPLSGDQVPGLTLQQRFCCLF